MAQRRGIDELAGKRVAVWGTGSEGRSMAGLAMERGAKVTIVADDAPSTVVLEGVQLEVRRPDFLTSGEPEYVISSPGVSRYRPELRGASANGAIVTSATALWLSDFADQRVVAVTGSKGKSTTVLLTAALLGAVGLDVGIGGNIGKPVSDFYGEDRHDVYVVEVSSFQAAEVEVSPAVGVLTLLSPDHIDWHGSYERYAADKLNLFSHRADLQLAVNATSPDAFARTQHFPNRHLYGDRGRVVVQGDHVVVDGETWVGRDRFPLRGRHNLVNLCGALTAAILVDGRLPDTPDFLASWAQMPPLPSRLRTVSVQWNIEFVDDALASNPAATVAALETFAGRSVCLIAGGRDRGVDLDAIVRQLGSMSPAPAVVGLGEAGSRLATEIAAGAPGVSFTPAATVEEAVASAVELVGRASHASRGPHGSHGPNASHGPHGSHGSHGPHGESEAVVLFSPGAPTPPSEGTYLDRSASFLKAVERRVARDETSVGTEQCGP